MLTYTQKQKQRSEKHQYAAQRDAESSPLQFMGNQAVIQMMSHDDTKSDPDLLEKIRSRSASRGGNAISSPTASPEQNQNTGIPAHTKQKFEEKSGFSYDDVKVHYNSDKPAELGVLAYAQGNQVYIGLGQEEHLEHELGHIAQQKAGMVRATGNIDGVPVNEDRNLERTANSNTNNLNYIDFLLQEENPGLSSDNVIQMSRDEDTSAPDQNQNESLRLRMQHMNRLRSNRRQTNIHNNRLRSPQTSQMPAPQTIQAPVPQAVITPTPREVAQITEISEMPTIPDNLRGFHRNKIKEQKILSKTYKSNVTGKTHESEHAIGYAVVKKPKSARGADSVARLHENILPAYQEVKPFHRDHIGTGSDVKEEEKTCRFGFKTDESYRTAQYTAISDKETDRGVSNAIQLNQLGYSRMYENINNNSKSGSNKDYVYNSRKKGKTAINQNAIKQADNSYFNMAKSMKGRGVVYYKDNKLLSRETTKKEAAEMVLARLIIRTGYYPSTKIENMVRKMFNIAEIDLKSSVAIDNKQLSEEEQEIIDANQEAILTSMIED